MSGWYLQTSFRYAKACASVVAAWSSAKCSHESPKSELGGRSQLIVVSRNCCPSRACTASAPAKALRNYSEEENALPPGAARRMQAAHKLLRFGVAAFSVAAMFLESLRSRFSHTKGPPQLRLPKTRMTSRAAHKKPDLVSRSRLKCAGVGELMPREISLAPLAVPDFKIQFSSQLVLNATISTCKEWSAHPGVFAQTLHGRQPAFVMALR